ncbi:ribonuclease H-like domain-containing protein [Zopfochytrium polystomum]|nr:ribonuclease H-like domain-containing protein [Zopfochytrium polystomum]
MSSNWEKLQKTLKSQEAKSAARKAAAAAAKSRPKATATAPLPKPRNGATVVTSLRNPSIPQPPRPTVAPAIRRAATASSPIASASRPLPSSSQASRKRRAAGDGDDDAGSAPTAAAAAVGVAIGAGAAKRRKTVAAGATTTTTTTLGRREGKGKKAERFLDALFGKPKRRKDGLGSGGGEAEDAAAATAAGGDDDDDSDEDAVQSPAVALATAAVAAPGRQSQAAEGGARVESSNGQEAGTEVAKAKSAGDAAEDEELQKERLRQKNLLETVLQTSSLEYTMGEDLAPVVKPGQRSETQLKKIGRYIAIDCEMVGVGRDAKKSALARVSIVNYHGHTLLDTYVQPEVRVTDYRTANTNLVTFRVAHAMVLSLIKDRVLVGHAIGNDLRALRITKHPSSNLRDTSKYAPFRALNGGRSPALRTLARHYLGLIIQTGEHSSVIDAQVTMELYKLVRNDWERAFKRGKGGQELPDDGDDGDGRRKF